MLIKPPEYEHWQKLFRGRRVKWDGKLPIWVFFLTLVFAEGAVSVNLIRFSRLHKQWEPPASNRDKCEYYIFVCMCVGIHAGGHFLFLKETKIQHVLSVPIEEDKMVFAFVGCLARQKPGFSF